MEVVIGSAYSSTEWPAAVKNYENLIPPGVTIFLDLYYHAEGEAPISVPSRNPGAIKKAAERAKEMWECASKPDEWGGPLTSWPELSGLKIYQKPGQAVVRIQYRKTYPGPGVLDVLTKSCVATEDHPYDEVPYVVFGKIVPFWQVPVPAWALFLAAGAGAIGYHYYRGRR